MCSKSKILWLILRVNSGVVYANWPSNIIVQDNGEISKENEKGMYILCIVPCNGDVGYMVVYGGGVGERGGMRRKRHQTRSKNINRLSAEH